MSHLPTAISLGDFIRAVDRLQPTDDGTLHTIAEILGLQFLEEYSAPQSMDSLSPQSAVERRTESPQYQNERTQGRPLIDQLPNDPGESHVPESTPSNLEAFFDEPEVGILHVKALEKQLNSEEDSTPLPFEPLLTPLWTRGILSRSISTISDDGPLDIEKLIETLASGECVQRLPRLPRFTLRHGVQLLVDKSDSLVPFMRDQIWMQREIEQVVGVDKVEILYFAGCPLRGTGTGPRKYWSTYRPPSPGTVVLLLTDLGIGRPLFSMDTASVGEWKNFTTIVHQSSNPLVAFVPYSPLRCSPLLRKNIPVIQWDRGTTTTRVHNLMKQVHR